MLCPKCGSRNKYNAVYCEKCLLPLRDADQKSHGQSVGMSFSNILAIVLCVVMIAVVAVFPLFSNGMWDIISFGIKPRNSSLDSLMQAAGVRMEFGTEQITGIIIPILAMIASVVMVIIGAVTRRYTLQNTASFFSLVCAVPLIIYSAARLEFAPGTGIYLYVILSVAVMFLTQSVSTEKNLLVIVGLAGVGLGAIVSLTGYFMGAGETFSVLTDMPSLNSTEVIGIVIAVIGGVLSVAGFESDLAKEARILRKTAAEQ